MKSFFKYCVPALLPVFSACAGMFTFDGPGGLANDYAADGISFHPAVRDFSYDPEGEPIPGTDTWRMEAGAPAVTVDNPADFDRGEAPSVQKALNALFQPVLVQLSDGHRLTHFSLELDADAFGQADAQIEFYTFDNTLLLALGLDQTVPGAIAALAGTLDGVDHVVLPAGAFYDDIELTAVPEPEEFAIWAGVVLVGAAIGRISFARRADRDRPRMWPRI